MKLDYLDTRRESTVPILYIKFQCHQIINFFLYLEDKMLTKHEYGVQHEVRKYKTREGTI